MAANEPTSGLEENSVSSRITLFNDHVAQHQQWQMCNPFSHYSVLDAPKRRFLKEEYGRAPSGSRSEQRALQAQVQSLQEMLQLCEQISQWGTFEESSKEAAQVSIKFGALFELYNNISDKLVGTLLRARKHKFVDFVGETLFQGRDDAVLVRLQKPFVDLQSDILSQIENLRCIVTEKERVEEALRVT